MTSNRISSGVMDLGKASALLQAMCCQSQSELAMGGGVVD